MTDRFDLWNMTDEKTDPQPRLPAPRDRMRRIIIVLIIAVTLVGVLTVTILEEWSWLHGPLFGVHGPSHYVSVTNDTPTALHWSCSWSDLHLTPGETGTIRVLDQPDQDFGCVPQPTTHQDDLCPSILSMTDGSHYTVTEFIERFHCRG